jgi:hypothetical protein
MTFFACKGSLSPLDKFEEVVPTVDIDWGDDLQKVGVIVYGESGRWPGVSWLLRDRE